MLLANNIYEYPVRGLADWEEWLVNGLFGALTLAALLWAIAVYIREKKLYPLMMFIGAGLAAGSEPLIDVMLQVIWPEDGNVTLFTAYGREIPPYVLFGWLLYFFPMGLWVIKRTHAGEFSTMRAWRWLYGGILLKAFIFELVPIWRYWWQYYGDDQPMMIYRLPLHWVFINTSSIVLGAVVVYLLQKYAFNNDDRYSPVYAFVYPMALISSYFATNTPVGVTLNMTDDNLLLTTFGGLLTIFLCVAILELCGRAVVGSTRSGVTALPLFLSRSWPAEPAAVDGNGSRRHGGRTRARAHRA